MSWWLLVASGWLCIDVCLLFSVCCVLLFVNVSFAVSCSVIAFCWSLYVVRRLLFRCSLCVACCLSIVVLARCVLFVVRGSLFVAC